MREIFPGAKWQLCLVHTVRASLSKVRKADRDELAEDLKAVYRADTVEQAHDALKAVEERWAGRYPDLVAKWLRKSYALLEFMSHPKPSGPTFTPRTSWRMTAKLKRRTEVVEVFCGPEALEKLVYLVLVEQNERFLRRRLKGFAEIQTGSYHAAGHTQ